MEMFDMACKRLDTDIVYNGDIDSAEKCTNMIAGFERRSDKDRHNITAVMIGRGAIRNPGIFREIRTGQVMTAAKLYDFLGDLYDTYKEMLGTGNAISKLKEVWSYVTGLIPDDKERARTFKAIIKSKSEAEYKDSILVARSMIRL